MVNNTQESVAVDVVVAADANAKDQQAETNTIKKTSSDQTTQTDDEPPPPLTSKTNGSRMCSC